MSDEHKQYASTAVATLEAHILSVHSAKGEAEWWAHKEILRLRAENKRTRSLLRWDIAEDDEGIILCDGEQERRFYSMSIVDALRAENEKLRAEIEEVNRLYKYHVDLVSQGICEANELRAENEKLREALKPFADAAAYIIPGIDDSQTVSEWEFTAGELRAAEKLYYGSE